ncbi:MAG: hypothetical protein COW26_04860 [Nitrosopumilales archaeon CG15_BIG_FIL_POST_REV_8_21_14_020_33_23]|nr:MAG: hypothetical protein COW26_04860 [Nitrosopumilales archaeon CG15_BIG_FIL_POST_REV_8_21_14_020_33_23]
MSLFTLIAVLIAVLVIPVSFAYSDEYHVIIKKNMEEKSSIGNTISISGHVPYHLVNMTVIYPDDTSEKSSLVATDDGIIDGFVYLDKSSQLGLYTISIISYDKKKSESFTDYFFLHYDGSVKIEIKKNASVSCAVSQNKILSNDDCISPTTSHVPKTFGVNFVNYDYKEHQFKIGAVLSDVIAPNSNSVVFLNDTGKFTFSCVFHPWLGGTINVTDVPLRFSNLQTGDLPASESENTTSKYDSDCSLCYVGLVSKIVDGDTIHVDKKIVRLSLVDTPEKGDEGFQRATDFTASVCPVGLAVLVDIDDLQPSDRFGRQVAKVTCGDVVLNSALIKSSNAHILASFCTKSEFAYDDWVADKCKKPVLPNHSIIAPTPEPAKPKNDTISIVSQTSVTSDDFPVIFLSPLVILPAVWLVIYLRKSSTNQDSQIFEFLE